MMRYIERIVIFLCYVSFCIICNINRTIAKNSNSSSNSTDNSSQVTSQITQANTSYIQQISNNPVIYAKNIANKITQNINKTLLSNNLSISLNKSTLESIQDRIQKEVTNLTNSISENKESITNSLKDKISDIISNISQTDNIQSKEVGIDENIGNSTPDIGNISSSEEEGGSFMDSLKEKISSITDNLKNTIGENISNLMNSTSSEEGVTNITNKILSIVNESINNGIGSSLSSTAAQMALNAGIRENIKDVISEKLGLLEQVGVSEETISKLNENISSIVDGPMQKLSEGDFQGAASSLSETVSKLKSSLTDTTTNIIEEKKEILQDTIIEKLGGEDSTLGSLASNVIADINNDVDISKIADKALKGDFQGAFDSIKESIGNLKETFSLSSVKEKASGILSNLFAGKKDTVKDTITSTGNTIKSAIGNSTLGSTSVGKALVNVIENAITNTNEDAISVVNDILTSSTDEERSLAIEKLKNIGLDLKDSTVSSALAILNQYKETIVKSNDDIAKSGSEEEKMLTENKSSPSVSDSEKNIDEYASKIQSESEEVEKEVYHSEVEENNNIEHEYLNHEGNNVATTHYESSIHGAKTNLNSSDNN